MRESSLIESDFSHSSKREGLLIRIHRAIQLSHKDSRLFVMPDEPNYRLRFVYRIFESIKGTDQYSRARVLEVSKKILKYAIDDLSKWIIDAASDLADKLEKDPRAFIERREPNFYRYGQPSPSHQDRRIKVQPHPRQLGPCL